MEKNKILVVVDCSYFCYYILFGAVNQFVKRYPNEANAMIRPAEDTDQNNLPNLLTNHNFTKLLRNMTMKRCEVIDWVLRQNFQAELDAADQVDTIFALDDRVTNSFRKDLYPEYKLQRAFAPKQFQIQPIKDYITNVIFKELDVENSYGYRLVKVDNAEGDDVIACTMNHLEGYSLKILFASDKDFLQIENVRQFDLMGKEVKRKVADQELSAKDFLLVKLLLGDGSDNIPKVFEGVGPKKVLKLIADKQLLKDKLKENQDAAKQYLLNKKLISFAEIPNTLRNKILEKVNEAVFELDERKNVDVDLADFMSL